VGFDINVEVFCMTIAARPRILALIAVMTLLTMSRTMVVTFFPHLEMYGGIDANAWFAPWVSETILGLLSPFLAYSIWRKTGTTLWALLIAYSFLGAWDYAHGLAVQWHYPQVTEGGISAVIYGAIGFGLIMNLCAGLLLLRTDVMRHFTR
jgi:hypothetical protein